MSEEAPDLASCVGRITHWVDSVLPPGPLAELRRMHHASPPGSAFWKLVFATDAAERVNAANEARWVALIQAIAQTQGLHHGDHSLGSALAHAGLSEMRLNHLLRSDGARFLDEVQHVARFLAAKGQHLPTRPLGFLVLHTTDSDDRTRRSIARQYFATQHHLTTSADA